MNKIPEQMVKQYGDKQIVVAIEEFSELTKELCKKLRGQPNIQNILEELADCHIVLKEMQSFFHITNEQLDNQINKKLQRTKSRYLDIEMIAYQNKCVGCEYEKRCHVRCETCEEYKEELEALEEMFKDENS